MEVLGGVGDQEADRNNIEEVLLLKIGANIKANFIFTFFQGTRRDEGILGSAVLICCERGDEFSCYKELDFHPRCRFARSGVKDVGGEFAIHEISSSKRSLAIFAISSSAVAISFDRL